MSAHLFTSLCLDDVATFDDAPRVHTPPAHFGDARLSVHVSVDGALSLWAHDAAKVRACAEMLQHAADVLDQANAVKVEGAA